MADINDFRDADGKQIQPYFAAYMIERGVARSADVAPLDYMRWIEARWNDFRAETGRGNRVLSTAEPGEFKAWLAQRCDVA